MRAFNPYLRHFGNVVERLLWTKNPQLHFRFWWRHPSMKIFYFMLIWNLLSSTNCTPLGLITWRHYPEISCDEHKCTWKPGNMVERHLWTKNPQLFFTRIIYAELFKKVKRCFLNLKKIFVDFVSTNDAPPYSRFVDFCTQFTDRG